MAQMTGVFAEREPRLIGERTRAALAVTKRRVCASAGPLRSMIGCADASVVSAKLVAACETSRSG
jgi:DNA invertase Pin-like site-specific DNA recombinase